MRLSRGGWVATTHPSLPFPRSLPRSVAKLKLLIMMKRFHLIRSNFPSSGTYIFSDISVVSDREMGQTIQASLLSLLFYLSAISAKTNRQDYAVLQSFKMMWENTPASWRGSDPCSDSWEGISCEKSRVIYIKLVSMGVKGNLSGEIQDLSELQSLDLSNNKGLTGPLPPAIGNLKKLFNLNLIGCGFFGPIPDTIGSLRQLTVLSLSKNKFSGIIPPSIGDLSSLDWLDLRDNQLTGPIPVSDGNTSGLDKLIHTKHFHFSKNRLSGPIPPQLFSSNMNLIHVLFNGNQLNGSIPNTLGLVETLEMLRLDRNSLSGPVPTNLNNLTNLAVLHLSHNKLTGSIPELTGMNSLSYVDLSNNSFDVSDVPQWFSTLNSLTTLLMEKVNIRGKLPQALFSSPLLQTVNLKNNLLNDTVEIGTGHSDQLQLIDLQINSITNVTTGSYSKKLILVDNPVCDVQVGVAEKYCMLTPLNSPPPMNETKNCNANSCSMDTELSPNCTCSYLYSGTLSFGAVLFSNLDNFTNYNPLTESLMTSFQNQNLPVNYVSVKNPILNSGNLQLDVDVFVSVEKRLRLSDIGFTFSNRTFKLDKSYGPYFFIVGNIGDFPEFSAGSKSLENIKIILGVVSGGLVTLLICVGVYAFHRKRRTKGVTEQSELFASRNPSQISGNIPQLKGARWFSFEELKKCTYHFSETNCIGSGGYGKVYRGILVSGKLVAIKRSQQGSMQGDLEFKTEIELLSRLHHKNLVGLVGFCSELGEQMLVYEYVPNGSLKDSLSGKSGIRLDWKRRLQVALGSARGLVYLHELANPTVIHRDIKSNNILLDDHLNAKVADFGLSKLIGDSEKSYVTTQVKGTMGYMDPEYYTTQQLTEKSDVYSFGVLMLELVTARKPIERGRYIVREVNIAMDKNKDLYGLHELLDPIIVEGPNLGGFERFLELAMRCVAVSGVDRPKMSEVLKVLESILQQAGLNPDADSAPTSESHDSTSTSKKSEYPYPSGAFDHSVNYSLPKFYNHSE